MPHEVQGVVVRAKGAPVTLETILVPDPGPGEALVQVQACGVCHTDLHYREGGINDDFPFLLGHEAAGVVEAVERPDAEAVIGCGGVGNAAIAGAVLAGATTVIGVDVDDCKLGWAKDFGATHTVNSRGTDAVEAIQELTGGFGADVVIDAVGRPETYRQAFYARDLAGTVVLVGVPTPEMTLELPLLDVFGRGGSLKSSWYGDCLPSRDFPVLIDLYLQGRLDLDRFVSETIALDDVEAAFDKMQRGEVLRSVVVF
jgi:S-(hydroxymethyl)mycothiol dehydrogenase